MRAVLPHHRPQNQSHLFCGKVMWVKENQPEIYKATYKFLQAKD